MNTEEMRQVRLRSELDGRNALGLPIGAGDVSNLTPDMIAAWNGYWDTPFDPVAKQEAVKQGNGGYLFRVGPNQATYSRDGMKSFDVCRESPLNVIANIDLQIGEYWERVFPGFKIIQI